MDTLLLIYAFFFLPGNISCQSYIADLCSNIIDAGTFLMTEIQKTNDLSTTIASRKENLRENILI